MAVSIEDDGSCCEMSSAFYNNFFSGRHMYMIVRDRIKKKDLVKEE